MRARRLVLISDTHSYHRNLKLPEGDILLYAGDITFTGEKDVYVDFLDWFIHQPFDYKCFIAGNHDFNLEGVSPFVIEDGIHYLSDSGTTIGGLRIWGSPWSPTFYNWAFMRDRGQPIAEKWNLIPNDIDVLITHGPPKEILDRPFGKQPGVGCDDLLTKVLKVKPKLHLFGHIHGDYGVKLFNGTTFVNASVVNEAYQIVNEPIVVDL